VATELGALSLAAQSLLAPCENAVLGLWSDADDHA
jgi:hypothetical protein